MSYSLNTRNTPYLHNYEAALREYNNIKPLRGTNIRPIAERRKTYFNIRKSDEGTLIVRLHRTDIINYTPDNRITITTGQWNTQSTRAAIHAVAGVVITSAYNRTFVRDHDQKHYLFKNNIELQAGAEYYYSPKIIDPIYPTVHTINRKELNQKLRQFRDYYNYLMGVTKVDGWRGSANDYRERDLSAIKSLDSYKDGVFALEPEAAFNLGVAILSDPVFAGKNSYWRFFIGTHHSLKIPTVEKVVESALKRAIIKSYKETLLTETTVTDGRIVKDNYQWALG